MLRGTVFKRAGALPWVHPSLEVLDELNDAEIYNAIVTSMKDWEQNKELKRISNRTKREDTSACYPDLGCFEASGPFGYLDMLPAKPEEINTRFLLYPGRSRRRSGSPPAEVPFEKLDEAFEWAKQGFNNSLPTKVLIHGFGSDCSYIWVYEIRSALMAVEEVNIICVDWSNGASLPNYVKASANTRLVGKQLSLLLRGLVEKNGLSMRNTHLIGFSLGAHIAGFAGADLGNLSRITAYRSSIHDTTGQTPASIVMGRELRLPCDLKFGCTPGDDVAGEDYVSTLRQRMDDIHERVRSNIQGASDRMKETYDINANDGRYQPGNQVWLYNPQRRRGLSPKLQSSWEGPYEVVTRINDVVYRIQKLPRGKPRVVHFNRLAPFAGKNDEQAEARVRHVSPPDGELSFEEFMSLHSNGQKARYGVTREEPRDLFQAPADFCLAHCVAADLRMSRGIALTFKKAFGQLEELRRQRPEVGRVLQITAAEQEKERSVFYLVTKQLSHHKPTYQTVWDTLVELRDVLLSQSISSLAIPKIASGLDGLDWRVIRSMLEVLFRFTGIEILVCCYNPRRSLNEKTVDCFFYQTSRCKNGSFCRYRHGPEDDTIRDEMSLRRGQCYERWASPPLPPSIPADRVV
ncbi:hypothetical protein NQ318_009456 [Aromia moschata]|uniref:C3H1-type domain-containing protein n=1 Tax=Aromia moschata TaxID=1265417 RepID=A0AAV8Z9Q8_9CUCU|nr:hypothetical protein NQ318_009456 [Aromia moschata]